MTESKLPEELLREILSYSFMISHESFCGFGFRGPLADMRRVTGPEACHNLLLVSKRWLRVGSPLLYESICLRTPTHAQTVAGLIKHNPILGRAVRQLKLFGGYGRDLHTIIKATPNLHTVYLNMSMKSSDSIAGIKKALPIMNPARLYIEDRPRKRNKKTSELRDLVNASIAQWSALKYVHYNPRYHLTNPMISALKEAPALEEVWLDSATMLTALDDDDRELREFLGSTTVIKMHCLDTRFQPDVEDLLKELNYSDKVQQMMVYEDYPEHDADDITYEPAASWEDSDDEFGPLDLAFAPAHFLFMAAFIAHMQNQV